jgi:BASS family bile acid:Na+ symporter
MQVSQELLQASIVVQVFGLGLRGVWGELAALPHQPARLARMLLARELVVPALVMSVLSSLGAPRPAIVGATLLAISPGALLLPQSVLVPRRYSGVVFGSSVVAALCSIVTVPFWLPIVGWLFVTDASVAPVAAARLAGILFLLPLALGVIVRRCAPTSMTAASGPVIIAADLLLWLALVPLVGDALQAVPELGFAFVFAVVCAPSFAVLAGVIAQRSISPDRPDLAHVCSTRHPGLALLVAGSNFAGEAVLPAVVVSFVGGLLASLLYTVLTRYSREVLPAAGDPAIAISHDTPLPPGPRAR